MSEEVNRNPTEWEQFQKKAQVILEASSRNAVLPIQELYMMGNLLEKFAPESIKSSIAGQCERIYTTYESSPEKAVKAMAGMVEDSRKLEATSNTYTEIKYKILGAERADAVSLDEMRWMGDFIVRQKIKPDMRAKLQATLDGIYTLYKTDFAEALNQMTQLITRNEGAVDTKSKMPNWLIAKDSSDDERE